MPPEVASPPGTATSPLVVVQRDPQVDQALRSREPADVKDIEVVTRATPAQRIQLLAQVALGLNKAEIGTALHTSSATAKTHVGRLLAKLGARDRTQLAIAALEAGLVDR